MTYFEIIIRDLIIECPDLQGFKFGRIWFRLEREKIDQLSKLFSIADLYWGLISNEGKLPVTWNLSRKLFSIYQLYTEK